MSFPRHYLSAATTNATLVHTLPTLLKVVLIVNTTAAIYYLKFYNKATAPIPGTDVPLWTMPVPPSSPMVVSIDDGLQFNLGLGFCLTGGIADNDATIAATGVVINLGLTGY
jgi:hypothetical protein